MAKNKQDEPDRTPGEMITRSFRLPRDLMEWLDREAKKDRRKTNNYLERLLSQLKDESESGRAG